MKQASDLKRHQLEEIANAAITYLFWDENASEWRLNKDVSGADFVEHMTHVLAENDAIPAEKPTLDETLHLLNRSGFIATEELDYTPSIRVQAADNEVDTFIKITNNGFDVKGEGYEDEIPNWDYYQLRRLLVQHIKVAGDSNAN